MQEDEAISIAKAWHNMESILLSVPWYDNMHIDNGGIVSAGDDGFYMEPDISVYKVFLKYKDAKSCCDLQNKKHRGAFIEKRILYM